MEELDLEEINERIQCAYANMFLLAIKKKINLRRIVEYASKEIDDYIDNADEYYPEGANGMMFFLLVTQMMGCSIFDVLYLSEKEKEGIIKQIIDGIDVAEIDEYDLSDYEKYFVYDVFIADEEYQQTYDYELAFIKDDFDYSCGIVARFYAENRFGFISDLINDDVVLWKGKSGEIFRFICDSIEYLEQEENENNENNENNEEVIIDYKDFFVHSYAKSCTHSYIKVRATVPVYSDGKEKRISFDADYCPECGVYYISENVYYNEVLPAGRLLCQVLSQQEYNEYKNKLIQGRENRPQSVLNMLGYNVNAKDNLSEHHRRTILKYAIESGLVSKRLTIFYLQTFIKKAAPKSNMVDAIKKWKDDLQWVYNYEKKGDIIYGARRIVYESETNEMSLFYGLEDELPFS